MNAPFVQIIAAAAHYYYFEVLLFYCIAIYSCYVRHCIAHPRRQSPPRILSSQPTGAAFHPIASFTVARHERHIVIAVGDLCVQGLTPLIAVSSFGGSHQ